MNKLNVYLDLDTPIVQSAMSVQTNYCVYKNGKFIEPTKSRKQWVANNKLKNPDLYEFRKEARLVEHQSEPILLGACKKQIREYVEKIKQKFPDREVVIVVGGENGNFREEFYPEYKKNRDGEILLRKKLTKWVTQAFPNVIVADGEEADDCVSIAQWKGYRDYQKTGVYSNIVVSIDKDQKTVSGCLYNPAKDTLTEISIEDADKFFCYQLLVGDQVDNVSALNAPISKELAHKLGVKHNSRGMGDATAEAILAPCTTSKECFERVIECYKDVYGEQWLEKLQREAFVLRMRHVRGEMYKVTDHLKHLGIDYD